MGESDRGSVKTPALKQRERTKCVSVCVCGGGGGGGGGEGGRLPPRTVPEQAERNDSVTQTSGWRPRRTLGSRAVTNLGNGLAGIFLISGTLCSLLPVPVRSEFHRSSQLSSSSTHSLITVLSHSASQVKIATVAGKTPTIKIPYPFSQCDADIMRLDN